MPASFIGKEESITIHIPSDAELLSAITAAITAAVADLESNIARLEQKEQVSVDEFNHLADALTETARSVNKTLVAFMMRVDAGDESAQPFAMAGKELVVRMTTTIAQRAAKMSRRAETSISKRRQPMTTTTNTNAALLDAARDACIRLTKEIAFLELKPFVSEEEVNDLTRSFMQRSDFIHKTTMELVSRVEAGDESARQPGKDCGQIAQAILATYMDRLDALHKRVEESDKDAHNPKNRVRVDRSAPHRITLRDVNDVEIISWNLSPSVHISALLVYAIVDSVVEAQRDGLTMFLERNPGAARLYEANKRRASGQQ